MVRANGIALHVAELGTGPLVLLLHGFPQFWWAWHRQLVDLADAGLPRASPSTCAATARATSRRAATTRPTLAADMAALVTSLGESDAMVVGNDLGGCWPGRWRAAIPGSCAALVVARRRAPAAAARTRSPARPRRSAQRRRYALRTFQVPRRPEHLLARDSRWVRELFDRWTGPRWRGTPGYVADVERYAEAMRIHPVVLLRGGVLPLAGPLAARADGRRYAASLRAPITAPVLQLHGDFDTLRAAVHRAGLRAVRHRRLRVAGARRRRPLPAQRGARAGQRRADPLGQAALTMDAQSGVQPPGADRGGRACGPCGRRRARDLAVGEHEAGVGRVAARWRTRCPAPSRRRRAAGRRSCRCARSRGSSRSRACTLPLP